jgi:Sec-independent protein secretion pathway component TatC
MPPAIALYDVVLFVHVAAVVVAFGVTFAYPVILGALERRPVPERAAFHRAQAAVGRRVILPALVVLILAGAYMASDRDYWSELWVVVPFIIAIVLGGLVSGFLAPREARLGDLAERDDPGYAKAYGQIKAVGATASLLVVVAIFFMTTKPG